MIFLQRMPLKSIFCQWQWIPLLFLAFNANAGDSMLRIKCEGKDIGAEVSINGKFRGECPLDITVKPGSVQVRAVKPIDTARERVFEQTLRIGEDTIKPLEVVLTERLTASGQKKEDERQREANQREANQREANQREANQREANQREANQREVNRRAAFQKGEACAECPDMVVIPAGNFQMGANTNSDEKPIHSVSIKSFSMGKTEVTQALWTAIMGSNPSNFSQCGALCPVEQVSWNDIQQFLQKLNALSGMRFRLPSEAEWEYAARSGSTGEYGFGDDPGQLGQYAWYSSNSGRQTHLVAQKQPNAFGLYDMHGNVWEWVEDGYHDNYNGAPTDGSARANGGNQNLRVLRGGGWRGDTGDLRSAGRSRGTPAFRFIFDGFRLARTLP